MYYSIEDKRVSRPPSSGSNSPVTPTKEDSGEMDRTSPDRRVTRECTRNETYTCRDQGEREEYSNMWLI